MKTNLTKKHKILKEFVIILTLKNITIPHDNYKTNFHEKSLS